MEWGKIFGNCQVSCNHTVEFQNFLEMGEQVEETEHSSSDYPLELVAVSSSWNDQGFKLKDISLQLSPGTLAGVIGPVGSGKSSLLLTIVREMEITEGRVNCGGTIGYYSQTPCNIICQVMTTVHTCKRGLEQNKIL
eukprot:sb/3474526/